MAPQDFAVLAMIQSLLGGSTAQEQNLLFNELARRLILSGLAVSPTGVFSFTVPFLNLSAITGGTIHGVLVSGGVGSTVSTTAGTSGQVLTSNGVAADPTFQATALPNPITQDLLFTDATYDIGKTGATRPRDVFASRDVTVGRNLTPGTVVADLLFTDGLYDIGKTGATRPRDLFASRDITVGRNLMPGTVNGDLLFTDATYDIGKDDTTRPRDGFFSRDVSFDRNLITPSLIAGICQGRLTLTSGLPVTISDVTGATTIYWTPYAGNAIALYDGADNWTLMPFVETALPLGTLTSGLPYDVFAFNNSGTLALELLAWTSVSARATALVLQNGVLVKSGATTRRYLGTFHTTATTTTEDSIAKRLVWNFYNRKARSMRVVEGMASWNYTTATFRQANGSTANQLACVVGVAEDTIQAEVLVFWSGSGAAGADQGRVGIGEDSTTTVKPGCLFVFQHMSGTNFKISAISTLKTIPAAGYHFYTWLEYGFGDTVTWFGNNGDNTISQSGMDGVVMA